MSVFGVGEFVAFEDLMWRYLDFLARAEAAYAALDGSPQGNGTRFSERKGSPAQALDAKGR